MHLSYPALYTLAEFLSRSLPGAILTDAFTQEKDELILRFDKGKSLRVGCSGKLQYLVPVTDVHRAGRNSTDIFTDLHGKACTRAGIWPDDRMLWLAFGKQYLILQMYGNRSNILYFKYKNEPEAFLNKPFAEIHLPPNQHSMASPHALWQVNTDAIPKLVQATEEGMPIQEALPLWLRKILSLQHRQSELSRQQKFLEGKLKLTRARIRDRQQALIALQAARDPEEVGHILMANAHRTAENNVLICEDFYRDAPISIPIKPGHSIIQTAEAQYNKSRKRKAEQSNCKRMLEQLSHDLQPLEVAHAALQEVKDIKALKQWKQQFPAYTAPEPKAVEAGVLPWRMFTFDGWQIRIGKNAQSNDVLTLHNSRSGDLWLHVKDYSGSHVVIPRRAGKEFPKALIDYAAGLAVWFSPRRHHTLVSVWVCDRKFVRKRKGMPAGAVQVERGDVLLIDSPKDIKTEPASEENT